MSPEFAVQEFPNFDPDGEQPNVSQRWNKWIKRFEEFMIVKNLTGAKRKRACLLYYAGCRVHDIFDTIENTGDNDDYTKAKEKLTEYFTPRRNVSIEILNFRRARQETNETNEQFHTRLQSLAAYCEFSDNNEEIKQQIILGWNSNALRRRLLELKSDECSLEKVLDIATRRQAADRDAQAYKNSEDQNRNNDSSEARARKQFPSNKRRFQQRDKANRTEQTTEAITECGNCGGRFPHPGGRTTCPAFGKRCYNCGGFGHLGKKCRYEREYYQVTQSSEPRREYSRPIQRRPYQQGRYQTTRGRYQPTRRYARNIRRVEDQPREYAYEQEQPYGDEKYHASKSYLHGMDNEQAYDGMNLVNSIMTITGKKKPMVIIELDGIPVEFLIVTGANIDVIPQLLYVKKYKKIHPHLNELERPVYAYGKTVLSMLGTFYASMKWNGRKTDTLIYVVNEDYEALLSYETAKKLELIKFAGQVSVETKKPT